MKSIKEQLVLVYCLADDGLKSEKNGGKWRKSNHHPKCTDAEIMAVAMMQSYFGTATLAPHLFISDAPLIQRLFPTCQVTNNGWRDGIG